MNRFLEETKYYRFGLMLGMSNLVRNRVQLGLKKSVGKCLQPINSYTRFPEYRFFGSEAGSYLSQVGGRPKVLDVSSPKCFGLYLAFHFPVEIHLTDIDAASVAEGEILWSAIRDRARGEAHFSVEDARALNYSAEGFDLVFAMSVIEHVADFGGQMGDSLSIQEMLRVLKPGGLLLISVPFGHEYREQDRVGLEGAARQTDDKNRHFFQRIYTPATAEERILKAASGANLMKAMTVERRDGGTARLYRRLGVNLRAASGCLNPFLSLALNDCREGISPVTGAYGDLWNEGDVYGDLLLAWKKEVSVSPV
jgi:SAM-dependent methyltransferase